MDLDAEFPTRDRRCVVVPGAPMVYGSVMGNERGERSGRVVVARLVTAAARSYAARTVSASLPSSCPNVSR
jgi:hypothetical protein